MTMLYLAWQDEKDSRRWFVIGCLDRVQSGYRFRYVRQAEEARGYGFEPIPGFEDFQVTYESAELFSLFSNRLLSKSRPDYAGFLERIGVAEADADPLTILSRTEGIRMTDKFEVFPMPEPDDSGYYHIVFLVRGIRHLPPETEQLITSLRPGDRLRVVSEDANQFDCNAVIITTNDRQVGWVPRYFCTDIRDLEQLSPDGIELIVRRVNPPPAPVQLRLLCSLRAPWPDSWTPFNRPEYQPLGDGSDGVAG